MKLASNSSWINAWFHNYFYLRPHLLKSCVHVIRFITNRKYAKSIVYARSDCHLTIKLYHLSIGFQVTMYCYKWSWLTAVELSISWYWSVLVLISEPSSVLGVYTSVYFWRSYSIMCSKFHSSYQRQEPCSYSSHDTRGWPASRTGSGGSGGRFPSE